MATAVTESRTLSEEALAAYLAHQAEQLADKRDREARALEAAIAVHQEAWRLAFAKCFGRELRVCADQIRTAFEVEKTWMRSNWTAPGEMTFVLQLLDILESDSWSLFVHTGIDEFEPVTSLLDLGRIIARQAGE